ncbi:MAG: type II toxin-antitoxin system Phd/YefM family antitoxin [Actinomycetota bacterium]
MLSCTIFYVHRINTSRARAELPELLDLVGTGEEVTITRHGRPVAVMIRPDLLRARRSGVASVAAEQVREALKTGRKARLALSPGIKPERAEQLLAEVKAGRNRR